MSKILKKECFFFGGHKIECRIEQDKHRQYLQIDVKKSRKLVDWIEIPLVSEEFVKIAKLSKARHCLHFNWGDFEESCIKKSKPCRCKLLDGEKCKYFEG